MSLIRDTGDERVGVRQRDGGRQREDRHSLIRVLPLPDVDTRN